MEAHPYTIIIADDDDDDRQMFLDVFQRDERFTIMDCLDSGVQVFDDIIRKKAIPDVLLVDMYMPHFTGIDVVKGLEEMHVAPTMYKFIISTTNNIAENESQLNSPYVTFLKKPVSVEEINALPGVILGYLQQRISKVS